MVEIKEDVKSGDIVYVWISPYKEKNVKKHDESEFKIGALESDRLQLIDTEGGYSLTYNKYLLDNWYGCVRKAN